MRFAVHERCVHAKQPLFVHCRGVCRREEKLLDKNLREILSTFHECDIRVNRSEMHPLPRPILIPNHNFSRSVRAMLIRRRRCESHERGACAPHCHPVVLKHFSWCALSSWASSTMLPRTTTSFPDSLPPLAPFVASFPTKWGFGTIFSSVGGAATRADVPTRVSPPVGRRRA